MAKRASGRTYKIYGCMQSCIARDRDRTAIISRPSADCRCPPSCSLPADLSIESFLWTFGLGWYLSVCCRELGKVRLNSITYLSMSIKIPRSIEIERARKQASSLARETQVVRAGTCPSQEHKDVLTFLKCRERIFGRARSACSYAHQLCAHFPVTLTIQAAA